jgi:hypothetical protein
MGDGLSAIGYRPLAEIPHPLDPSERPKGAKTGGKKAPSPGPTGRVPAQRVAVGGEGQRWSAGLPPIASRGAKQ